MDRSGWLSELLDSLVVFERSVLGFRINPTNRKLHKIKRQQLRLFIPSQLGKGVHNIIRSGAIASTQTEYAGYQITPKPRAQPGTMWCQAILLPDAFLYRRGCPRETLRER